MTDVGVPKKFCIYGGCVMHNLCKSWFCVGANLLADGYIVKDGELVRKEDESNKDR